VTRSAAGGSGTVSGVRHEGRCLAWAAAHMLVEKALPEWATGRLVSAVGGQSGRPVDDVAALTSDGGWVCLQAKAGLNLGTTPKSTLAAALEQVVAMYDVGVPDRPPNGKTLRRLDRYIDRVAVVSDENASEPIRIATAKLVNRLRTWPDEVPLEEAAANEPQRRALRVLTAHLQRLWLERKGVELDEAQLCGMFRILAVRSLELRAEGADLRAVMLDLQDIVEDPATAPRLWRDLCEIGQQLAEERAWLVRDDLIDRLQRLGHALLPSARLRPDIGRLSQVTRDNVATPPAPIHIDAPDGSVEVVRDIAARIDPCRRNLAITGLPGSGKSALLHSIATSRMDTCDVVYLTWVQLQSTAGATRVELNLTHDLSTVLRGWTGSRPGLLLLDGIDQTRGTDPSGWLPQLVKHLDGTRWRIIATIRAFDLRHSFAWREMFAGSPDVPEHADAELSDVAHVCVGDFSDGEIADICSRSPALARLFASAPSDLRMLLANPFNLSIAADLIRTAPATDLSRIRDRLDLLGQYWRIRVASVPNGRLRERVLRAIVGAMVSKRAQYATDTDIDDASMLGVVDELLRDGVLRDLGHQPWPSQRPVAFSHPVVFDYAAALMALGDPNRPDAVAETLDGDPDLAMLLRPSLDMRMAAAWRSDSTKASYWRLALRLVASESGHIIAAAAAAAVAAAELATASDLQELRTAITDSAEQRQAQDARTLAFLVADAINETARAEPARAFAEFVLSLAEHARTADDIELAHLAARLSLRATDKHQPTPGTPAAACLVRTAVAVTLVALADPTDARRARLAGPACRALAMAAAIDTPGAADVVRAVVTEPIIRAWGANTVWPITGAFREIAAQSPDLAADIGAVVWLFDEDRTQVTDMLGSQILPLTSNRQQDLDSLRYQVGKNFDALVFVDIRAAARMLTVIAQRYVRTGVAASTRSSQSLASAARPLVQHGSTLRSIGGHRTLPSMVDTLTDGLHATANRAPDQLAEAISALTEELSHAEVWQRLLARAATLESSNLCVALLPAISSTLLAHADTWQAAGHVIARLSPLLDTAEHQAIEAAVLTATEPDADDPEPRRAHLRARRDTLLSAMQRDRITHPDAVSHLEELAATGRTVWPLGPSTIDDEFLYVRESSQTSGALYADLVREVNEARDQYAKADERHLANQRMLAAWPRLLAALAEAPDNEQIRTTVLRCAAHLARLPEAEPGSELSEQILANCTAVLSRPPDSDPHERVSAESIAAWVETPHTNAIMVAHRLLSRPEWQQSHGGAELRRLLLPYLDSESWVHRYLATKAVHHLYPDPDQLLAEAERRLASEPDRHVSMALVSVIRWHARTALEADEILSRVFGPTGPRSLIRNGDEDTPARDDLTDFVAEHLSALAVHHDTPFANTTVRAWLANPIEHANLAATVAQCLRNTLNPTDGSQLDVQRRAFDLLELAIEPLRTAWSRIQETTALNEDDQTQVRNTVSVAYTIAQQVQLASDPPKNSTSTTAPSPSTFAELAIRLLEGISSVHHPMVTHEIVEAATHLSTAAPKPALLLAKRAVVSDKQYVYERLAVDVVLDLITRYLTDHRALALADAECTAAIRLLLEGFVRAGWPQAIRFVSVPSGGGLSGWPARPR